MRYEPDAFSEISAKNGDIKYRTLYVKECLKVYLERDHHAEPLASPSESVQLPIKNPSKDTCKVCIVIVYIYYCFILIENRKN